MSWKQEDGWKKPGDRSHRKPRDRGKPGAPVKADSGEVSTWEASKQRSQKRGKRRKVTWIVAGVAVVLLLLVAVAPMIASIFAPGIIASKASDAIAGRVEVGSARLGWLGEQRVERVRLYDNQGEQRGEIAAKTDMGLLFLLLGGGDYGTITLSGELDTSTNAKGETFLEHTIGIKPGTAEAEKPAPTPAPSEPLALPTGLKAGVRLDALTVTYGDKSVNSTIESVRLNRIDGEVFFDSDSGGGVLADLNAQVQSKNPGDRVFTNAGAIRLTGSLRDLVDPGGAVRHDTAVIDGKVELTELSTALLDIMPDLAGKGKPALGPTLSIAVEASGPMNEVGVTLTAESESLKANAPVSLDLVNGSLHSTGPITAGLDLGRLSMLMPDRDDLLGPDADLHVTEYPRLDVTIEDLSLPIPPGNTADLRGAGAKLLVQLGALAATVQTPGDDSRRAVGFEPATISLDAPDLAGAITLRTDLNTTIDDKASGTLRVDLAAENLLDDTGAISVASPPTIRGEVTAEQLVLAAFQPIAAAAGFDLTGVIGETADLTLAASPVEGETGSTDLVLDARADHATIAAAVRIDKQSLRATGEGIKARFDHLDPLLAEALAASGLNLTNVSGATIRVPELHVDLEAAGRGDMSTVRLVADAGLEQLAGVLTESGERLEASGFTLHAEATPLRKGVHVTAAGGFKLNGADAGTLDADLRAFGLLDAAGAMSGGLPSRLAGKINAAGVRTGALQPFLAATGLSLEDDIGPTVELTITANAKGDTGDTDDGTIPPTVIWIALKSEKLNSVGGFNITNDRVVTIRNGISVRLADPGGPLARLAPLGPGMTIRPGAVALLNVTDLSVPLDQATRRPDLPNTSGTIRADIKRLVLQDAQRQSASVPLLSAVTTLSPGSPPRVEIEGSIASNDQAGVISGAVEIHDAFNAIAPDGRIVARPVGDIEITDIPVGLLALAGVDVPRTHAADIPLQDLAGHLLGPTASLRLSMKTGRNDNLAVSVLATTPWHRLEAGATVSAIPGGGFEPVAIRADGRLRVSQSIARQILALRLPWKDAAVEIPGRSDLLISLDTDNAGVVTGELTLEPTTVGGLSVTDADGKPRALDPLDLRARASLTTPLAALTDPENTHDVSLTASAVGTAGGGNKDVIDLDLTATSSILDLAPAGATNARVELRSGDTGWLDALSGSNGLIAQALGRTARIDATLSADATPGGPMGGARADIEVNTPRFKTTKPISLTTNNNTLTLAEPLEARWDLTPRLFDLLAPVEEGKAAQLRLADTVAFTLRASELRVPLAGSTEQVQVQSTLLAPSVPVRFPDGSDYTYRDLRATLFTLQSPGSARLRLSATDADRPDSNAVDLNATVRGLPDGSEDWSPENLVLSGEFGLDQFPIRLLDAMATGQGDLVELLGKGLDLNAQIKNLPRRGGTFTLDAKTQQANAKIRATVRLHPVNRETPAVTLDEPMQTRLTHFDYDLDGKKISFLPIFGSIKKVKGKHDPASVTISRLVAPVDGDVALIIMDGMVDPGVVEYDFQKGLAVILDIAKQNKQGKVGERLQPFTIGMKNGVARFDDLVVPVGEFNMQARGAIDLVNQTEDIVLGVPAGAFADEVIGNLPGAGGALKGDVIVPVRRRGPLGEKNPWRPDFEAVLGNLFENLLKGGLEDLLKGQGKD